MMDVSQLVAGADTPVAKKRPGRKPKAAAEQAPAKPKRKYTRRASVQPVAERAFAIFLGEDDLQLAPAGGGRPGKPDLRRRAGDRDVRRAAPRRAGVVTA